MRTKTLLLAAAALAAGLATSMAQTVYSVNIVGYANNQLTNAIGLHLASGYNMIANQFDVDGNKTNNTLATVFSSNLPNNSVLLAWNGSIFIQDKWVTSGGGKWAKTTDPFVNASIQPGHGFFLSIPTNVASPLLLTLGNCLVNTTNTIPITVGYQVVSPSVPATGGISSVFGYKASKNDLLLVWNPASQIFVQKKYSGTVWGGGEPVFSVGQAAFLNTTNPAPWNQIFTVQ